MRERKRIGLREVQGLQPGQRTWDAAMPGFHARRQRGEAVSYILAYRTADGRQRRYTIGRHGAPWTPEQARAEAVRILGEAVKGGDPAGEKQAERHAVTVAELCGQHLADAEAGRLLVRGGRPEKRLPLLSDRGRIEGHIIPLPGKLPVAAVTKQDVERFMHAVAAGATARSRKIKPRGISNVRGGRGVATRSIGLLGVIFAYAIDHQMRQDDPAHRIRKFAENKRERRLSDEEYAALGEGLKRAQGTVWPPGVAALRCLARTGWRAGEAVALRWQDVDLARRTAMLPDTKSGRSMRPVSRAACDVLRAMHRIGDGALVFPATRGEGPMPGFKKFSRQIFALAELPKDVTRHVLRHSFAGLVADLGDAEPTIGALIGHKGQTTTSRYMHAADAVVLAAADAVAKRTTGLMGEAEPASAMVPLRAAR